MSTVIHTHAMPDALRSLAQNLASGSTGRVSEGMGFFDLAVRETEKKGQETGFAVDQLNLDEYKNYLSARISSIPIDPSRALDSFTVRISDEGFAAMQADPEYEEWVLGRLSADWAEPRAAGSGSGYFTYSINGDRETFRSSSVDLNAAKEELEELDHDTETFWERRHRRHEEYMELAEREQFLRRLRNGSVSPAEYLLSGLV